jgi:KipI family sensor histidine kinase inhibitor
MPAHDNNSPSPRILPLGDQALTVEFGDSIDLRINRSVLAFAAHVERSHLTGVQEIVPTYRSATVYFDPFAITGENLALALRALLARPLTESSQNGTTHSIPVLYGGSAGPDLEEVAHTAKLTSEQVIELHCSHVYHVYMLGFSPGFPYLGTLPPSLVMPRLATPRKQVAAGSVGLAGGQTGIYPQQSPGGWRIIGCTPVRLFSMTRARPFLLQAGDQVRFVPIAEKEFQDLSEESH